MPQHITMALCLQFLQGTTPADTTPAMLENHSGQTSVPEQGRGLFEAELRPLHVFGL